LGDERTQHGDERTDALALWDIPIEIHLFRAKARQTKMAEQFWKRVVAGASGS
jgi:hypothetical protein